MAFGIFGGFANALNQFTETRKRNQETAYNDAWVDQQHQWATQQHTEDETDRAFMQAPPTPDEQAALAKYAQSGDTSGMASWTPKHFTKYGPALQAADQSRATAWQQTQQDWATQQHNTAQADDTYLRAPITPDEAALIKQYQQTNDPQVLDQFQPRQLQKYQPYLQLAPDVYKRLQDKAFTDAMLGGGQASGVPPMPSGAATPPMPPDLSGQLLNRAGSPGAASPMPVRALFAGQNAPPMPPPGAQPAAAIPPMPVGPTAQPTTAPPMPAAGSQPPAPSGPPLPPAGGSAPVDPSTLSDDQLWAQHAIPVYQQRLAGFQQVPKGQGYQTNAGELTDLADQYGLVPRAGTSNAQIQQMQATNQAVRQYVNHYIQQSGGQFPPGLEQIVSGLPSGSAAAMPPMPTASAATASPSGNSATDPSAPDLVGYTQQLQALMGQLHAQYPDMSLAQLDAIAEQRLPNPLTTQAVRVSVQGQPMYVTLQQYLASKGEGFDKYDPARTVPWLVDSDGSGQKRYVMLTPDEAKEMSELTNNQPITVTVGGKTVSLKPKEYVDYSLKQLELEQKASAAQQEGELRQTQIDRNRAQTKQITERADGTLPPMPKGAKMPPMPKTDPYASATPARVWPSKPQGGVAPVGGIDLQADYARLGSGRAVNVATGRPASAREVHDFMATAYGDLWDSGLRGKALYQAVRSETQKQFALPKTTASRGSSQRTLPALPSNFRHGGN